MASNKTEKATPKKKDDARKKGQVARSADLNSAVVVLATLGAMAAFAPFIMSQLREATLAALALIATPGVVEREGIGAVLADAGRRTGLALAPVAFAGLVAGGIAAMVQVGFKPAPQAIKPDPKKLNPIQGAKNLFGTHALFEGTKTLVKIGAIGAIVAFAVFPQLDELAALVGLPPSELLRELGSLILGVSFRAAGAYLVIAAADFAYQRWKHEKNLRMEFKEVKDEFKQQGMPAEVKSAQRRRQMQAAQNRMMDAVPTADVIVTNPTHFSVALRYDGTKPAPEVVAKGQDRVALRIREIAAEHGVPVVPDPPLARALHGGVEVGQFVPEEFFQAVASVLAFVYRMAGRRASA